MKVRGQENTSYQYTTTKPEPSIWKIVTKDTRLILFYLSKNKNVLEVIRNCTAMIKDNNLSDQSIIRLLCCIISFPSIIFIHFM